MVIYSDPNDRLGRLYERLTEAYMAGDAEAMDDLWRQIEEVLNEGD